jgi:hypothetical protein
MDAVVKGVCRIDHSPVPSRRGEEGNSTPTWVVMSENLVGRVIAGSRFARKDDLAALLRVERAAETAWLSYGYLRHGVCVREAVLKRC